MVRRADQKKERAERAKERGKMIETIILSTIICSIIVIVVIGFLISKLIFDLTETLGAAISDFDRDLLLNSPFTYLLLLLQDVGLKGYLTLFHVLISGLLILFFVFLYVTLGNIREYQRAVAGWFELIVVFVVTLVFAIFFMETSSEFLNLTVVVLTCTGCFAFSVYLYYTQ